MPNTSVQERFGLRDTTTQGQSQDRAWDAVLSCVRVVACRSAWYEQRASLGSGRSSARRKIGRETGY